jgi:hypothetical protein
MSIKNNLHVWVFISIILTGAAAKAQSPPPPAPQPTVIAPTQAAPQPTTVTADETKPSNEKVTPLDNSVAPASKEEIPGVFKNMVVVQRKAKKKANKWLFSPYVTIDFSDGPITDYAINTDIGYALSDFWEVYVNAVPAFIVTERPIVQKVKDLGPLASGKLPQVTYAKPQSQFGLNVLWLPAYGKESWGAYSIVRSDTFVKMGVAETNYDGGTNGMRFTVELGKTYFVSNWLNVRVAAGISYWQSIVDDQKNYNWVPVLETGLNYYF